MPKEVTNSRIDYANISGRVNQHDIWLNQAILISSSPTFSNLLLTGDAIIQGNLYVEGNTTIIDTNVTEFRDNILLINNAETGSGVTLNQAGLEVDRGLQSNYRMVYDETTATYRAGVVGLIKPGNTNPLEAILFREDSPLNAGIMVYSNANKRAQSTTTITLPIVFTNTTQSTNTSTGTVVVAGGVGISKNLSINGTLNLGNELNSTTSSINSNSSGNLNITTNSLFVNAQTRVRLPDVIPLEFGASAGKIMSDTSGNVLFSSGNTIKLTPTTAISIPNQIPIIFSTPAEQIYTDSSNNMVIAGSQDLQLNPGIGKKVLIPVNIPVVFSNNNQQINSNINNDLTINAGNNIFLTPGAGLDVRVPTNSGIKFGATGDQLISANNANKLTIKSTGDLNLFPSPGNSVSLSTGTLLAFANTTNSISGDSTNMYISVTNKLQIAGNINVINTTETENSTTGSIHTNGGIGAKKTILSELSLAVDSTSANALIVKKQNAVVLQINNTAVPKINIQAGDGTSNATGLSLNSTSQLYGYSLLSLESNYDTVGNYFLGRGTNTFNSGRVMTVNLPNYSQYANAGPRSKFSITSNDSNTELFSIESETGNLFTLGTFNLSGTANSTSPTTGSIVVYGGLGVVQDIFTSGKITNSVDSTVAFAVLSATGGSVLNVNTVTKSITANANTILNGNLNVNSVFNIDPISGIISTINTSFTSTTTSLDSSSGAVIISGGVAIGGALNVNKMSSFANGVNMLNNPINNLSNPVGPQDAATKAYVDLVKQGLYVKDSVKVATTTAGNLTTDFIAGNTIDSYILVLGDRILIKNQINMIENGLYNITNGPPTRTIDLPSGSSASGVFCFVQNGNINAALGWICNTPSYSDNVDSMPLNFTQFTGLGQVSAGSGIIVDFNQVSVNTDNVSLEIIMNALRIKNTALGTGLTGGSGTPLTTTTDQSHVTKLGTVNTGVWQANTVQVLYGGTGNNRFTSGNILFGNGNNPILTDFKFFYDQTNSRLGLGTNTPTSDIHIKSQETVKLFLDADTDANNSTAYPEIVLGASGTNTSALGMTRNYNQYGTNVYSNSLVLSNNQLDSTSVIQLVTNQNARLTILANGNVGVNTSAPQTTLDVNGTFSASGIVRFVNGQSSTSSSVGSVLINGGMSIIGTNSTSITRGGSLTISGGAAVSQDVYIGGTLTVNNTNSVRLNITSTEPSLNSTTGAIFVSGGITIQNTSLAVSISNGGSLLTLGGMSVTKNTFLGGTLNALTDAYLGGLYFTSVPLDNYIESPDITRTIDSFVPINFTNYLNTSANTLTISKDTLTLNNNTTLVLGKISDNYNIRYTTGNLDITPNVSGYNLNIGATNKLSNVNFYSTPGIGMKWDSTDSTLSLINSSTVFSNTLGNTISVSTPNTSGTMYVSTNSSGTLNFGQSTTGSQLTTVLSNNIGNSTITFTPSNTTNSNLILTSNINSTFNGPVTINDKVRMSGNSMHTTITNSTTSNMYVYIGSITGYTEIDFFNGMTNSTIGSTGLKITASSSGNFSHSHYGSLVFNSINKTKCEIYQTGGNFLLYANLPSLSSVNMSVLYSDSILTTVLNSTPIGTFVYTTAIESNLQYTFGDTTLEGQTQIADNLPVIGYNNSLVTGSRDLGMAFQRYQQPNDIGSGDIVNDNYPEYIDSVPSQVIVVNLSQIQFSNLANSVDDYYKGWWLKVYSSTTTAINQVRKIISYNGAQRVATLSTPFTTTAPDLGDVMYLYNNGYVINYYDEIDNTFSLSYTNSIESTTPVVRNRNADLRLSGLYSTNTTPSTNSTSGSILVLGSIAIENTSNAISCINGGTFTSAGGMGITKDLFVGQHLAVGPVQFTPTESIHIRNTSTAIRLEHNAGLYSYTDYVESGTGNRYGILFDSSVQQFSITYNATGLAPNLSQKMLTITTSGNVGINCTSNINSSLTLLSSSYISTNSSTGYLGLSSSSGYGASSGSELILHSDGTNVSAGSIDLRTTSTTGTFRVFNENDKALQINSNGTIKIYNTAASINSTTGSLVLLGGIGIMGTQNSASVDYGGSLTVNGGAAIKKDLYLGGNLFITGSLNASGSVTSPVTTFSNAVNCTFNTYYNNKLMTVGGSGVFILGFDVFPTVGSENTEIQFSLPGKTNTLTYRAEVINSVSGYVDDTSVTPLFNVIAVGNTGTVNVLVKFQSVNTALHYITITCNYAIS